MLYTYGDFDVPSLENAAKDKTPWGEDYDPDNDQHFSEWALSYALYLLKPIGRFTEEQLNEKIVVAKLQQALDAMVQSGLLVALWDEEQGAVVYRAVSKA